MKEKFHTTISKIDEINKAESSICSKKKSLKIKFGLFTALLYSVILLFVFLIIDSYATLYIIAISLYPFTGYIIDDLNIFYYPYLFPFGILYYFCIGYLFGKFFDFLNKK